MMRTPAPVPTPAQYGGGQPPLVAQRAYDRGFYWTYHATAVEVPPTTLLPIGWDGLNLNPGDDPATGMCAVVEDVAGWLDGPPLVGNDQALTLADGVAWGAKTLGARVITLSGAAIGPPDLLAVLRDQLASRAASRYPAPLSITNASGGGKTLTAMVRGDSDQFKYTWVGLNAFRWQVVLTAADPALYGDWQQQILAPGGGQATGRNYQRAYSWQYASSQVPNTATLANGGNWPAPVYLLYLGDLAQSTITDDDGSGTLVVASLAPGMDMLLASDSLLASAEGGVSRAAYVLPGSTPLVLAPQSSTRWHLYSSGGGQVTLSWREAWI